MLLLLFKDSFLGVSPFSSDLEGDGSGADFSTGGSFLAAEVRGLTIVVSSGVDVGLLCAAGCNCEG